MVKRRGEASMGVRTVRAVWLILLSLSLFCAGCNSPDPFGDGYLLITVTTPNLAGTPLADLSSVRLGVVSGVAALVRSAHCDQSASWVRNRLMESATAFMAPPNYQLQFLNAGAAVNRGAVVECTAPTGPAN
jgi:hypothetical protein